MRAMYTFAQLSGWPSRGLSVTTFLSRFPSGRSQIR